MPERRDSMKLQLFPVAIQISVELILEIDEGKLLNIC
jgi:hypothetical protein